MKLDVKEQNLLSAEFENQLEIGFDIKNTFDQSLLLEDESVEESCYELTWLGKEVKIWLVSCTGQVILFRNRLATKNNYQKQNATSTKAILRSRQQKINQTKRLRVEAWNTQDFYFEQPKRKRHIDSC